MALKAKIKPPKQLDLTMPAIEDKVEEFINQGGAIAGEQPKPQSVSAPKKENTDDAHRLTLRIPKWLMDKVDAKRKARIGTISRNQWILEQLEICAQD